MATENAYFHYFQDEKLCIFKFSDCCACLERCCNTSAGKSEAAEKNTLREETWKKNDLRRYQSLKFREKNSITFSIGCVIQNNLWPSKKPKNTRLDKLRKWHSFQKTDRENNVSANSALKESAKDHNPCTYTTSNQCKLHCKYSPACYCLPCVLHGDTQCKTSGFCECYKQRSLKEDKRANTNSGAANYKRDYGKNCANRPEKHEKSRKYPLEVRNRCRYHGATSLPADSGFEEANSMYARGSRDSENNSSESQSSGENPGSLRTDAYGTSNSAEFRGFRFSNGAADVLSFLQSRRDREKSEPNSILTHKTAETLNDAPERLAMGNLELLERNLNATGEGKVKVSETNIDTELFRVNALENIVSHTDTHSEASCNTIPKYIQISTCAGSSTQYPENKNAEPTSIILGKTSMRQSLTENSAQKEMESSNVSHLEKANERFARTSSLSNTSINLTPENVAKEREDVKIHSVVAPSSAVDTSSCTNVTDGFQAINEHDETEIPSNLNTIYFEDNEVFASEGNCNNDKMSSIIETSMLRESTLHETSGPNLSPERKTEMVYRDMSGSTSSTIFDVSTGLNCSEERLADEHSSPLRCSTSITVNSTETIVLSPEEKDIIITMGRKDTILFPHNSVPENYYRRQYFGRHKNYRVKQNVRFQV